MPLSSMQLPIPMFAFSALGPITIHLYSEYHPHCVQEEGRTIVRNRVSLLDSKKCEIVHKVVKQWSSASE